MRLQSKLLAVLLPLSLLSAAGILLSARRAIGTVLISGVAQRAFTGVAGISAKLASGIRARDEKALLPLLNDAVQETKASYALALDTSGAVVAHTNVIEKGKTYGDPNTLRALRDEQPGFQMISDERGAPIVDAAVPIWAADDDFLLSQEKGGKTRIGTLRLGLPLLQALATRNRILASLTAILLICGGILGVVVLLFLRHMLRPVHQLANSVVRIGRGHAGVRVPVLSQDELGDLAASFNFMSENLAATTVSKDYLDNVINAIADPILVKDDQLRWVLANEALCRLTGLSRGQLLGKTDFDYFPKSQADAFRAQDARILEMGQEDISEDIITNIEGKVIPISTRKTLYLDQAGKKHVVAIIRDLTVHMSMEKALLASNERFRQVAEQSGDWIWEADAQGRFTYSSPVVKKILGHEPQDIIGRFLWELTVPAERERLQMKFALDGARSSSISSVPMIHEHKDGRPVILEVSGGPIPDAAGDRLGFRGVSRDVTERQKLETMLRQSEKMSAVGRLAGGVAHDFNNLLTAITGFGTFLLESLPKGEQNRADVEEIMNAADRAAALTRQLLAFSRRQVLQPAILDLNNLIGNTAKMLKRIIGEDVQLVMRLAPALSRVKADPGQLEQVVMNLAVNARDAMPRGGRLTIETADAHFEKPRSHEDGEMPPGRYVMIAVSDTGAGMSREVQSHIFEPFFTTKESGKGTGLGLATVHGIVTQSGGTILVYSEEGRGACFKVYLPAIGDQAQPLAPSQPGATARGGVETILLVEDDVAALNVAQRALQAKGYRILPAGSPADALSVFAGHPGPVHLLLTDMVMPGMDGVELSERLLPMRAGLKVLYMSGYTEHAALRQDLLAARKSFLQKPFQPEQLCAKVREVLDQPSNL